LLAVLLAFGRLSSDNEITVLKASGLSLYLLLPPVLIVALLAGALTLFISLVAVPWGNSGFKQMTVDVARKYAATAIRERIFLDDIPGIVLYVDHYDEATRRMERVMIQDGRDPERPLTILQKRPDCIGYYKRRPAHTAAQRQHPYPEHQWGLSSGLFC